MKRNHPYAFPSHGAMAYRQGVLCADQENQAGSHTEVQGRRHGYPLHLETVTPVVIFLLPLH